MTPSASNDAPPPVSGATAPASIEARAQDDARSYVAGRDVYLTQQAAMAPAPVTALQTLPRDVASFTGRQTEADALLGARRSTRVVTIHTVDGMPGVGKTALAVHAAHQLTGHYPDGQLFVRLHAHTPGQRPADPSDALAALLISIGVDTRHIPEGLEARAGLWRSQLSGRRMLLVLDDAASHSQVEPLLPGAEGCLVVITSRRRLAALDGAAPVTLDTLQPADAALLFLRLAGRDPGSADGGAVAEIVRLCGHLPLAIALLAGRFAHHPQWDLAEFAAEFARTRDRLGELAAGDRATAAAFELSYRALPERRRLLFRRLGLHPGPDIDARATAALHDCDLARACRELEALYNDHLIDSPVTGRYRLHDLIRSYAGTLARSEDPPGDREDAVGRLLDHYQHTARTADSLLAHAAGRPAPPRDTGPAGAPGSGPATRAQALAWMRTERANLIACTHYATTAEQYPRVISLTAALATFLRRQGPWDAAAHLHRSAAALAHRIGDGSGEADALWELGRVRQLTGSYKEAAGLLQQALTLHRSLGNQYGEAGTLRDLGRVRYLTGDYPAAVDLTQQALLLYRTLGNRYGEANALRALAWVRYLAGDYAEAGDLLGQALDLYRALEYRYGEAGTLWELSRLRQLDGTYPAAAGHAEQALALYRALGNRYGEANALWALGRVRHVTGSFPAAAELAQRALDLYRGIGDRLGEAGALWDLGRARHMQEDHLSAGDLLERALAMFRSLGNRYGEAGALRDLGRVRHRSGDTGAAAELFDRSRTLFEKVGDLQGEAEVLNSTGDLLLGTTGPHEASQAHLRALALARRVRSPLDEARALEGLAHCRERTGEPEAAARALRDAVALYARLGAPETHPAATRLAALPRPGPAGPGTEGHGGDGQGAGGPDASGTAIGPSAV
ncbi:ATPase [Streptomyces sulfonofaciens]|uniref:ATPase n=1 Tax=Streptomyces sulfonofaciens TaxID=68272 RepID=A0A919GCU1_9ACTN|nr:tetratricopeptide repeat protein [Streptomyces sulfonofaciens]GHH82307.1 ATPase [Streptomyces sulfonofaciens]